jgi:predicted nucleotidyltransferase
MNGVRVVEPERIERLLGVVVSWARQRPDVRGVALVGSWARGAARPDSDVDLVVLTDDPDGYVTGEGWIAELGATRVVRTLAWGPLTERRLLLDDSLELEVGVVLPTWAATDPLDPGTRQVVSDGMRILHDPEGLFEALQSARRPSG